jgi:hypothetical protein
LNFPFLFLFSSALQDALYVPSPSLCCRSAT